MDGSICQDLLLWEAIDLDSSMSDITAKTLAQVLNHAFDSGDIGESSTDEGDETFPRILTHDSEAMELMYCCSNYFIPIYRGGDMRQIIVKSKTLLDKEFFCFFRESLNE